MNSNADSNRGQIAQLSPPGEKPVWFTYSSGDRPLEGYTIKRGIGSGGFGEVYYAVSDGGKEVALKQIQRHLDVELRGVSQCLNLKHPNLVVLYDVRQSERGENWVVMEFVSGDNLAEVIEKNPDGMAEHEVLSLLRGICDGVSYLHEHGIVHRDLKPGNIFIENSQVKIGDYGLAKFISASRRSGQTESVGTVHYMAPELAHGRYGKEIDLYAIGVIIYEMLTGRVPFHGQSPGEILMKHLTAQPDASVLPPAFQPIVARLLAKAPEARYPSVEAMLTDLENCLAGRPHAAAPPPPLPGGAWGRVGEPPADGPAAPDAPRLGARRLDPSHPPGGAGRSPVPRVSFWFDDAHGGFSKVEGVFRFDGSAVKLEFQVKPLGLFSSGLRDVAVPIGELQSIQVEEGWFTTSIVMRGNESALNGIPQRSGGRFGERKVRVARNDRVLAQTFVDAVVAARAGGPVTGSEPPVSLHPPGYERAAHGAGGQYAGHGHADTSARSDRLVRPVGDRVWLGVCSGLAARIGIDPVPIRVVWVLLTVFSGFFMFLFGYLILAMIMPESSQPSPIAPGTGQIRRLVRPRRDRKWGGVCSGFAAYFGMDPVWVRVFTVVATFLTGFVPGLFFYLILCWAMPEGEPAARAVPLVADLPASRGSLSYFGRVVARLPIALFCGGGVGAMVGATCQMMGSPWNDFVAAFFGVGSGLLTVAMMLVALCRGLGLPHSFWPAWTTLFAGAGTGLSVAGWTLVRLVGGANDEVAAFGGVGCGLLAAAFVGFTLYASLNRSLGWRWVFVVPFLGVGAGMLSGGAGVLLNVRDEIAALVSVGVGLLVAGGLAWMLIFGRWAERLRPATALAGGSSGFGGTGSDLKQTMTFYGPGVSNRAMVLGPSLFLIVLCIAWLGAYAAFWLHGARQPQFASAFARVPTPVVIDWEVNRFGGHNGNVKALAFDAAGRRLATGDSQGAVRIWDLSTNTAVRSLTGHNNEINSLAFSRDGLRLAAAANCQDVRVWNTETGDEVSKSINHPGPVKCVAFSPDGTKLATGSSDDAVRLLDASTGQVVKKFFGCKYDIGSVAFLPDGNRLMAVGNNDTHIRIWDITTGKQLKPLSTRNSTPWLKGFVVSPDGRTVAGTDFGATTYLWETETARQVGSFSIGNGGSSHATLAFGPDGSQIATIDWPDVKIREVPSGRVVCTFKGHTGSVLSVAMSPDGSHVVSSGTDNTVRLWEIPATLHRPAATHAQADDHHGTPTPELEIPLGTTESIKSADSGTGESAGQKPE